MSKRSIRKVRHFKTAPSIAARVKAGQDGSIALLWQEAGFNSPHLTANQKTQLNAAVQEMIDKAEIEVHEHGEHCDHDHHDHSDFGIESIEVSEPGAVLQHATNEPVIKQ